MARKMRWLVVVLALAVPASAAADLGKISGYVLDSKGAPQMGALVEVYGAGGAEPAATAFSDPKGFFEIAELAPGKYSVKASATSFLPSLRENLWVRSGTRVVLNLTLNTLYEAMQLVNVRRRPADDDDEWKWTLRSVSNRPILRILDEGSLVVVSSSGNEEDRTLKAKLSFVAGSERDGFGGGSDLSTALEFERSLFSAGTLALDARVAYGEGDVPNGVLRAAYRHRLPDGSTPEVALTMRRFASPDMPRFGAIEAIAFSVSNGFRYAELIELQYGAELQAVEFLGRSTAVRPHLSAVVHLSESMIVGYRFATWQPSTRLAKGFDTAPADLSESGPRMSLVGGVPRVESARHQEVSLSRRFGDFSVQAAFYSDRIRNTALTGVGDVSSAEGDFLPDIYSGTFSYNAGTLDTSGLRLVAQRKLNDRFTATLDYAYGGAVALQGERVAWDTARRMLRTRKMHALSGKLSGSVPGARTKWITSYRWTSEPALSPVDAFDASPGQSDPYLNVFIRQPIPGSRFWPDKMEALIDVRNLLAEGYVPVIGRDGQTLYLVQAARSIRGGLAFTF